MRTTLSPAPQAEGVVTAADGCNYWLVVSGLQLQGFRGFENERDNVLPLLSLYACLTGAQLHVAGLTGTRCPVAGLDGFSGSFGHTRVSGLTTRTTASLLLAGSMA